MAGEGENKDKAMSSNLKAAGVCRRSTACPVCHTVLHSSTRVKGDRNPDPKGRSNKGFSHTDFAGVLHGHFAKGCKA